MFSEKLNRKQMNFLNELKYLIEKIRFLLVGNCLDDVKLHF